MIEHWKNLSLEDIEGEIWKPILNYEGIYEVSNKGRIKSLSKPFKSKGRDFRFDKIMKLIVNPNGYLKISLCGKQISVHRIVAIAFVSNPNNKPFVNHIIPDPKNNTAENLEFCTQKENIQHAYNLGRGRGMKNVTHNKQIGENHRLTFLKDCDVLEIRKRYNLGESVKNLLNYYGLKEGAIRNICIGKSWKHLNNTETKNRATDSRIHVCQISLDGFLIAAYDTVQEASKITGLKDSGIRRAVKEKNKIYKNYYWK